MFCLTNNTPNVTADNDHWMTVDCVDRVIRVGPGTWQCHPPLTTRDISLTSDHEVAPRRGWGRSSTKCHLGQWENNASEILKIFQNSAETKKLQASKLTQLGNYTSTA